MSNMIPLIVKEEDRYSKSDLLNEISNNEEKIFGISEESFDEEKISRILDKLLIWGIVKKTDSDNCKNCFKFSFVGVIIIEDIVITSYPKYMKKYDFDDFKQVIKVIKKVNRDKDEFDQQDDFSDEDSLNILPVLLFLIRDYFENGLYETTQEIIEINGNNEILWGKTVDNFYPIIVNNRPIYTEFYTKKRVKDLDNYFRKLHETILTECFKQLDEVNLLDLFDFTKVILTDETLDDFNDNNDNILDKIKIEKTNQFNTRKLKVLTAMEMYLSNKGSHFLAYDCLSVYGTKSFHYIWEKVCCTVLNDVKDDKLSELNLPVELNNKYNKCKDQSLMDIIERPSWYVIGEEKPKKPDKSLEPDLITIDETDNKKIFFIFDAKYYNIRLQKGEDLDGQPGIQSITKQYLYQLAFKEFVELHQFDDVKNCFLFPIDSYEVENRGFVQLKMLNDVQVNILNYEKSLENIQALFLPAKYVYNCYLEDELIPINKLKIN